MKLSPEVELYLVVYGKALKKLSFFSVCCFHVAEWEDGAYSSLFILDVTTKSQKDHKLFSATNILCSKKLCNKKIEGSPLIKDIAKKKQVNTSEQFLKR